MIVVDIGCSNREGEESVRPLIERFKPDLFFGFDPDPNGQEWTVFSESGCKIVFSRKAAWVRDGEIGFRESGAGGIRSFVGEGSGMKTVPCFDLAAFVAEQPEPVVLKLDCEGAEYALIPHLIETGSISNVRLLLVEFHDRNRGGNLGSIPDSMPAIPVPWEVW